MLWQLVEIYQRCIRILTPGRDQHVHRFLWRNLETNRDPDVYVKIVLTFGDTPAPAMAQIALGKTAEQEVDVCCEAAETLKKNIYNICDSVTSLEKAENLTDESDTVLAKGGFKVKGWISNCLETKNVNQSEQSLKVFEGASEEKVLGVIWNNSEDTFAFVVKLDQELPEETYQDRIQLFEQMQYLSAV